MADDVERPLICILQQTNFAPQLDETLTYGNEALLTLRPTYNIVQMNLTTCKLYFFEPYKISKFQDNLQQPVY